MSFRCTREAYAAVLERMRKADALVGKIAAPRPTSKARYAAVLARMRRARELAATVEAMKAENSARAKAGQ